MKNNQFSVLIPVYFKENPFFLSQALESVFNQTLLADEVILLEDGRLSQELDEIISKFEKNYNSLKVIKFAENRGLGYVLNDGLKYCKHEYVFRMDSDDICRNDRFEKQLNYMLKHPEVDALGSNILEFKGSIDEIMRKKPMPSGKNIDSYILKRNPLNHMTVCFKKSAVLKCGGYQPMPYLEDYYLWIRMFCNHMKLDNINEDLVYARVGNGFELRRGNKKQLKGWRQLQIYMFQNGLTNRSRYYLNIFNMYLMVFSPKILRKIVYSIFLRKSSRSEL